MAKKKPMESMAPKAPSLNDQLKWSAQGMARTAMENHPKVKKMHNHITKAVMGAAKKAMKANPMIKGPMGGNPIGY